MPISDELAGALELHFQAATYQGDDDPVFCHPLTGKPYDDSKIRKRFYAALAASGIGKRITFHGLRHTFGTTMASAGTPQRTLQGYMGHKQASTTEIYTHFAADPLEGRRLVERAFGTAPLGPNLGPI